MSALSNVLKIGVLCALFIPILLGGQGCKREADIPTQLRQSDFHLRATVTDSAGRVYPLAFTGGDTLRFDSLFNVSFPWRVPIQYGCEERIHTDSRRSTRGQLQMSFRNALVAGITFFHPVRNTDPTLPAEWRQWEVEETIRAGQVYDIGDGPGQVSISIFNYEYEKERYMTSSPAAGGYMRVEAVDDYGSPGIGVAYFGKRVRMTFAATLTHPDGATWTLSDGEAVLFYRYFN